MRHARIAQRSLARQRRDDGNPDAQGAWSRLAQPSAPLPGRRSSSTTKAPAIWTNISSFCDGTAFPTGNASLCRVSMSGIRNRLPISNAFTCGRSFESMRQVSAQHRASNLAQDGRFSWPRLARAWGWTMPVIELSFGGRAYSTLSSMLSNVFRLPQHFDALSQLRQPAKEL
jgi:hypothetical protein